MNNYFTVLHQNIAGCLGKVDHIKAALEELKRQNLDVHVLCLCETFIESGCEDNFKLPNHKLASYFSRLKQKRGGSMILVKKSLEFKPLNICKELSIAKSFECCGIVIPLYKLVVINIYRTPKSDVKTFLTKLQTLLEHLEKSKPKFKIIISGDWNIDLLKTNNITKYLISILTNFKFKTHIMTATRRNACLDQIASNIYRVHSNVHLLGLSDHETAQSIYFPLKFIPQTYTIQKIDYNKDNINKFKECMSALSFSEVYTRNNANEAFDEFHHLLQLFNRLCFPKISVKMYLKISKVNKPKVYW